MSQSLLLLDGNSIYLALFWRPSPPGDQFHWGVYVKTADVSTASGTLYHASNDPSWHFAIKANYSFESSFTAVLALKIGTLAQNHTKAYFDQLFAQVPVGHSVNEPATVQNPWDCTAWIRDAIRILNQDKIIDCPDVHALASEARRAAVPQRDITGQGGGCKTIVSSISR